MAGHSQFANIKYRKERQDQARGKVFAKLSREITVSVKQGGGPDPAANARLAAALERAKACNMPKENIDRAIKRATGELPGTTYEEMVYEGYGPDGVAVMLSVITDNRNRTAAEIRHLFEQAGGALGGSVAWMFDRRGVVRIAKAKLDVPAEDFMLLAMDWGAEDFEEDGEEIELYCDPAGLSELAAGVDGAGVEPDRVESTLVPQNTIHLEGKAAERILRFVQNLDEHDDVQNVYANFDVPAETFETVQ
jgi:YebC/PmpR family DNA-binding regulatory protein